MTIRRTLLLNYTYEGLSFIDELEALVMVIVGKADLVAVWEGEKINSPSVSFDVPATIRLRKMVRRPLRSPKFARRVLFNRDNWTCQYCGRDLTSETATVDHVIPKSRGGRKTWKNCVTSCKPCNKRKANRTPDQAGIKLITQPHDPSSYHMSSRSLPNMWHESWTAFVTRD